MDVRDVIAVLCTRFELQPYRPRPGAPFFWGEEKVRPRRYRLMRQFAAIEAEQHETTQAYTLRMRELVRRREACLIELAMTDLYAREAERPGKPDEAESAPDSGAEAASTLARTEVASSGPGSAEALALPEHEADPGSEERVSAAQFNGGLNPDSAHRSALPEGPVLLVGGASPEGPAAMEGPCEAAVTPEMVSKTPADSAAEHLLLDPEKRHALVKRSAPGWFDVDAPPRSVRERFPLYDMPRDSMDLDHLDLNGLLPRLATVHDNLVEAAPVFEDHLLAWFRSEDGAGCRVALEQAIERETTRRALWTQLLGWYSCVLALAADAQTPQEAETGYDELQARYRKRLSPGQYRVWHELTLLMPERPWLGSGISMGATFDEGDLYDMPDDGSGGTSAYEDEEDPQDDAPSGAGTT